MKAIRIRCHGYDGARYMFLLYETFQPTSTGRVPYSDSDIEWSSKCVNIEYL